MKMWQRLKKVDWGNGWLDLIVFIGLVVGGAVYAAKSGTAQATIQEFNTSTQTWTKVQP